MILGSVPMLLTATRFYPLRLSAYIRNEVEMEISVKNEGESPRWIECDVILPEAISLAPDRMLSRGRMRVGIALPGKAISKKLKIFGGASSYPDVYHLKFVFYGYGQDGAIAERQDAKADLRCEKTGHEF